jgi:alkylation response protein AidB-like acyl-CoA dehydrogenase
MADLLQQARDLGPTLAERSERIEAHRTLPDDVVADLTDAGLFRLLTPADLGGPELDVATAIDVIAEVSRHDGAAGWCVMIAGTTSLQAGFLPLDVATLIFGPADSCVGGYAAPVGRAVAVDGGLRVTGTWAWGSGTHHCTWIGGGARIVDADGTPTRRDDGLFAPFVFFDRDDVEHLDTWHVTGLAGSGSADYRVDDAFVPEGRWLQLPTAVPRLDGPQWRFPFYGMLAAGVAAVAVGLLNGAVDRFAEIAVARKPEGSGRTLSERASGQTVLSSTEATARSSLAFLHDVLGEAWETAQAGDPLTVEHRRSLRLAACDAAQRCADALGHLQREAGGSAVYLREPLQRMVRDGQVAATHAMVAPRIRELTGRLRLGLDTDTALL